MVSRFSLILYQTKHFTANWNDSGNRRAFFTKFAKENEFDPLDPKAWYLFANELVFEKVIIYFYFFHYSFHSLNYHREHQGFCYIISSP